MSNQNPQRSNEPPVWLMFSAGGMVSGLAFPVLILILGVLLPFGMISPEGIFPMWAGLHRVHHGMHDIKVHVPAGGFIFYGLAVLYTIVAIWGVAAI